MTQDAITLPSSCRGYQAEDCSPWWHSSSRTQHRQSRSPTASPWHRLQSWFWPRHWESPCPSGLGPSWPSPCQMPLCRQLTLSGHIFCEPVNISVRLGQFFSGEEIWKSRLLQSFLSNLEPSDIIVRIHFRWFIWPLNSFKVICNIYTMSMIILCYWSCHMALVQVI